MNNANNPYRDYLALLREIGGILETLTAIAKEKALAVRRDDLMALDGCIRREQALSLSLRGCEQRRAALVGSLGLKNEPLGTLAAQFPSALRDEAAQAVVELKRQYKLYCSAADVARTTLECNLHQIEKFLAQVSEPVPNVGYSKASPVAEPPQQLRTDFHA